MNAHLIFITICKENTIVSPFSNEETKAQRLINWPTITQDLNPTVFDFRACTPKQDITLPIYLECQK